MKTTMRFDADEQKRVAGAIAKSLHDFADEVESGTAKILGIDVQYGTEDITYDNVSIESSYTGIAEISFEFQKKPPKETT
jgi:hypothetical protein